jgi:hypothetical protein
MGGTSWGVAVNPTLRNYPRWKSFVALIGVLGFQDYRRCWQNTKLLCFAPLGLKTILGFAGDSDSPHAQVLLQRDCCSGQWI